MAHKIYLFFYIPKKINPYSFAEVSPKELAQFYDVLYKIDGEIYSKNGFEKRVFPQLLLDQDSLPGNNPPWGLLTAVDLNSGRNRWQIPFGQEKDLSTGMIYRGARNIGGAIITQGRLVFATGTTDEYARAYDLDSGAELWKDKLPYAGSAPPMTYKYNGCQYVLFNASGGRFVGFGNLGDATVSYKISACK